MTAEQLWWVTLAVTVVAAIRSTWSPCGLSMLSTITPMAERSRGHRYAATVCWFVAGSVLGGLTLGLGTAAGAAVVDAIGADGALTAVVVVAASTLTIAADLRVGGFRLPTHPRQVNEVWLGRYRRWVYAGGFGWQIGVGVSTYIMTAAVHLMIVLAVLLGDPLLAIALGAAFGLVRGLAVLLGVRARTPEALRTLHRRLESLGAAALLAAVVTQTAALATAVATATRVPAGVAVGCAVAAFAAHRVPVVARDRLLRSPRRVGARPAWPPTT